MFGLWSIDTTSVKLPKDTVSFSRTACVSADTISLKKRESDKVHGVPVKLWPVGAGHYLQSNGRTFLGLLLPVLPRLRGLETGREKGAVLYCRNTQRWDFGMKKSYLLKPLPRVINPGDTWRGCFSDSRTKNKEHMSESHWGKHRRCRNPGRVNNVPLSPPLQEGHLPSLQLLK